MKKHFYSHLVEVETLIIELDKLDLDDKQKTHLAKLLDSSLHGTILDAVLSELPDHDRKLFLDYLNKDEHDKIWQHLHDKIDNIEDKIIKVADELKDDLHQDIKEAKKR